MFNYPSIAFVISFVFFEKWRHQTFPSMLEIINIVFPIIVFPYYGNTIHLSGFDLLHMCIAIVYGIV
jgi:hypothetical protein